MTRAYKNPITYFLNEGRENLHDCIRLSFEAAIEHEIGKILVFTAAGRGIQLAIEEFASQERFASVRIIGVTFPQGREYSSEGKSNGISADARVRFEEQRVPIVRAHLPFDPIPANHRNHSILGQDITLIGNALGVFGGGMSLCVQAILMACDAGVVDEGEHVIALSADTSILARSAPTTRFLTDFIVREIICKPLLLTISRKEPTDAEATSDAPTLPTTLDAEISRVQEVGDQDSL